MKRFLFLLIVLLLSSCSNNFLDQQQLQEIHPDKSLIEELISIREKLDKESLNSTFKIQFHGQSIVKGIKEKRIKSTLQEYFPKPDFEIINTARSGLQVPQLLPFIEEDIYSHQADVLFFHAYGGTETGELEKYFEFLDKKFQGKVIIFNHHLSYPEDKVRNKKLTTLEDLTSIQMEETAKKYKFGFIDVRKEWSTFLDLNKELKPTDLLRDGIHPNEDGKLVLEWILMEHFTKAINQNKIPQ
ncbi:MAG: hypothetical protein ABF274_09990 [Nonlabens sp.]|uniref:SGNH/GDSL hydrolase family protein n=1 Tax=Nonlabens sp. TaxID=1888209 RepID=UPI00321AA27D